MKTIKFLFTVTAVALVAIATAVEKPKMNVIPLTAERAIVAITNENAARIELSIYSEKGEMVYFKQSSEPLTDYLRIFDFESLEKGNYVLNLKVNDTRLSRDFTVDNKGISVGDSKLRFDPYFEYKDNVLKFSYLNFDKENLKFAIYNNDDMVYQSKIGNDFTLSAGYDLSKLSAGNYKVVLSSYNKEFSYDIVK
ncbi:MAG: hypothetical protein EOM73_02870 [Bacteroidia bacterium]|nr:hypothetical protein [Bacteroidia bacterium]